MDVIRVEPANSGRHLRDLHEDPAPSEALPALRRGFGRRREPFSG
jgi:hypothetical protein